MATKVRSSVAIAMIWLATVAGVSATAWFAIDRAGRSITGVDVSSLHVPSGATASRTAPPTAPPTAPSGSSPSSPPPSSSYRDQSVSLPGGQVSVRCTGAAVQLRIAQPANGWRVEVNASGPAQVDLEFKNGDDDSGREARVTAVCKAGAPEFSVQDNG